MGKFATGVAVVGVRTAGGIQGMTVNSIASVSLDPPILSFCVRNQSSLLPGLRAAGRFSVNLLAGDQVELSRHFAGRPLSSAPDCWSPDHPEPALIGALGTFLCGVASMAVVGDHTVFFGSVERSIDSTRADDVLVYLAGRYRSLDITNQDDSLLVCAPRALAIDYLLYE